MTIYKKEDKIMSKNKNHGNNVNYKEVEEMANNEEIKDVETEVVDDQEKPEGENKPETKPEEPKKENILKRLWKNKWVRFGGSVLLGVAFGAAGAYGVYKHYDSSDAGSGLADAVNGMKDHLPEIATTVQSNVAAIADNHPVDVTVDKVSETVTGTF